LLDEDKYAASNGTLAAQSYVQVSFEKRNTQPMLRSARLCLGHRWSHSV
jgi:hypothetical protein